MLSTDLKSKPGWEKASAGGTMGRTYESRQDLEQIDAVESGWKECLAGDYFLLPAEVSPRYWFSS